MTLWQRKPEAERGILVATDRELEWLLPWWWKNYSAENTLPVTFVDLDMSEEARNFCASRGELVSFAFNPRFIKEEKYVMPDVVDKFYGKQFWRARQGWFKKPFALLQTRFKQTLWLDLDCEVLSSLEEMFMITGEMAAAREPLLYQGGSEMLFGEALYNSGVLLYKHGCPLIETWAKECYFNNEKYLGDQNALSRLIFKEKYPIVELPDIYNARVAHAVPLDATIIHWVGSWGKEYIRKHGGLRDEFGGLVAKKS